jgi:hypothetical protein
MRNDLAWTIYTKTGGDEQEKSQTRERRKRVLKLSCHERIATHILGSLGLMRGSGAGIVTKRTNLHGGSIWVGSLNTNRNTFSYYFCCNLDQIETPILFLALFSHSLV